MIRKTVSIRFRKVTDGRTDERTDARNCYINIALLCWCAIKTQKIGPRSKKIVQ